MSRLSRWQDLVLPVGLIASVLVIIVPLPAAILDVMLAANITVSDEGQMAGYSVCLATSSGPNANVNVAVSPDNQFQRLGSIVNVRGRNEAEIKSETAFDDFGLLLTTEDVSRPATVLVKPAGSRVGVITIIKQ